MDIPKPVEERTFTPEEKAPLARNEIVNDSVSIAKEAMKAETATKIANLRAELGLPPEVSDTLAVSKEGALTEKPAPVAEPTPAAPEKIEAPQDPEEKLLENKLTVLQEELAALSPEEKMAIINGGGTERSDGDGGGGGSWSHETQWEFKRSGKRDITFLQLMVGLMEGKPFDLKKLVLIEKYIKGMKDEVTAERVTEKTQYTPGVQ